MKYEYNGTILEAVFGKIEELEYDAISLPTTPSLCMDCGITLKIKSLVGQQIENEAVKQMPGIKGDAILTGAGGLPAKKVFHCVMLDENRNACSESLERSIKTVFEKAEQLGLKKLAFPAVGASFPGLDPKTATEIIVSQAKTSISEKQEIFSEICFIVCDSAPYMYFKKALKRHFKK